MQVSDLRLSSPTRKIDPRLTHRHPTSISRNNGPHAQDNRLEITKTAPPFLHQHQTDAQAPSPPLFSVRWTPVATTVIMRHPNDA